MTLVFRSGSTKFSGEFENQFPQVCIPSSPHNWFIYEKLAKYLSFITFLFQTFCVKIIFWNNLLLKPSAFKDWSWSKKLDDCSWNELFQSPDRISEKCLFTVFTFFWMGFKNQLLALFLYFSLMCAALLCLTLCSFISMC